MYRTSKIKITDLNPRLMCLLCNGYLIDAMTITECLHSFCKTCILKHLECSNYCPKCEIMIHKTKPHNNIRADKTLQDIVYKLVPSLFKNEMKRRRKFYEENPIQGTSTSNEDRGEVNEFDHIIYTADDKISMSLQCVVGGRNPGSNVDKRGKPMYLLCPAAVTIRHLIKFIRMKFSLLQHKIELFKYDETLIEEYTLMDIAYIYSWRRRAPLDIYYRAFKLVPKKRKLTGHSTEQTTESSSMEPCATKIPKLDTQKGLVKMAKAINMGLQNKNNAEGTETKILPIKQLIKSDENVFAKPLPVDRVVISKLFQPRNSPVKKDTKLTVPDMPKNVPIHGMGCSSITNYNDSAMKGSTQKSVTFNETSPKSTTTSSTTTSMKMTNKSGNNKPRPSKLGSVIEKIHAKTGMKVNDSPFLLPPQDQNQKAERLSQPVLHSKNKQAADNFNLEKVAGGPAKEVTKPKLPANEKTDRTAMAVNYMSPNISGSLPPSYDTIYRRDTPVSQAMIRRRIKDTQNDIRQKTSVSPSFPGYKPVLSPSKSHKGNTQTRTYSASTITPQHSQFAAFGNMRGPTSPRAAYQAGSISPRVLTSQPVLKTPTPPMLSKFQESIFLPRDHISASTHQMRNWAAFAQKMGYMSPGYPGRIYPPPYALHMANQPKTNAGTGLTKLMTGGLPPRAITGGFMRGSLSPGAYHSMNLPRYDPRGAINYNRSSSVPGPESPFHGDVQTEPVNLVVNKDRQIKRDLSQPGQDNYKGFPPGFLQ